MKSLKRLVIVAGFLLATLYPGGANAAVVTWYDGDTTIYQYMYFYAADRTVSYDPYGIAIYKYDGPAMLWVTHDCVGNENGFSVVIPNDDPTGWHHLKPNGSGPTNFRFCLGIQNYGSNQTDSFHAMMEWDGTN